MFKNLVPTIFGAVVICAAAAVPTNAGGEIDGARVQGWRAWHGQNGEPTNPATFPIIWGQQANYLYKELHDYHSGDRNNPIMSPIAKGFSLEDLRKVANYFAAKSWPPSHAAAAPTSAPDGIAVCKTCHQPNFEGGAPAPRLAGLSYEYLLAAMNGFADDQRTTNLALPTLIKALTPTQREAIARDLSAL